jgi:hypothetical protein
MKTPISGLIAQICKIGSIILVVMSCFLLQPEYAFASAHGKKLQKKSAKKESLVSQAQQEVELGVSRRTPSVLETPATVRARVVSTKLGDRESQIEWGVLTQSYRVHGVGEVTGFVPFSRSELGQKPMVTAELRWLPIKDIRWIQEFGVSTSIAYAMHSAVLSGPAGHGIDDIHLHTIKSQVNSVVAMRWAKDPRWRLRGQIGIGQINLIQTSKYSAAQQSDIQRFAALGAFVENQIWAHLSLFAGYEYQSFDQYGLSLAGGFGPGAHNLLIGIGGSFL